MADKPSSGDSGRRTREGSQRDREEAGALVGQTIGKYRLERLLGIGGMGQVYLAVHPVIGSKVAIKVLGAKGAKDARNVDRFFREAQAVNVIQHEGIVNVLDMDQLDDGRPYLVMEYLAGVTLLQLLAERGPLALPFVARIAEEGLRALAAAHEAGIVHRDLKPENILITPEGRCKLLDFGVAKLSGTGQGSVPVLTRTGEVLGTPYYMAPEQVASARGAGPAADIYAMGVILFECVTGQRPFKAKVLFELFKMIVDEPPPWPHQLREGLPLSFEAVIMRAMAKDPTERFESAMKMARALLRVRAELGPDADDPALRQALAEQDVSHPAVCPTLPMSGPPTERD
jgi:serine/threonine protein kinase